MPLVLLAIATVDQKEDVGYNAMQVNYELLTERVDPQDVLKSMFAHELISFEQKKKIKSIQQQKGRGDACEEMLDALFNNWKKGTCERFIQVLGSCDYKDCAANLQSNVLPNLYNKYVAICWLSYTVCTNCRS